MNGKIKTKFAALFAVALMITVCVVPVVDNAGTDAAPVSSTNGEVFEGYDITLYKEGGDYSGLVYYDVNPNIAGYSLVGSLDGLERGYFYNSDTGKFLTIDEVPGYVPPAHYGFPLIQFVYDYDDADVNPIAYTVEIKKGNDVIYNKNNGLNQNGRSQSFLQIQLLEAPGLTDFTTLTEAQIAGDLDIEITAKQGVTQQVINETVNAGEATTVSGVVKDADGKVIEEANVAVKVDGTAVANGLTTDENGKYTIDVVKGSVVEITSVTASGYTFGTEENPVAWNFGEINESVTRDYSANEKTGTITVQSANGVPISNADVKLQWYYQYSSVTGTSPNEMKVYNIGVYSSAIAGITAGYVGQKPATISTPLTVTTGDDGTATFTYVLPSGTTTASEYDYALVAYVVDDLTEFSFTQPKVPSTSTQTSTSSAVPLASQINLENGTVDVKSGSGTFNAKESVGSVKVQSANNYPIESAKVSLKWYYEYATVSQSAGVSTKNYTVSADALPSIITNGTKGFVDIIGSDSTNTDGVISFSYSAPTGTPTYGADQSDYAFVLYASISDGAGYTFEGSISTTGTITSSLSSTIASYAGIGDAQSGNVTLTAKENAYEISGIVEGVTKKIPGAITYGTSLTADIDKDGSYKFYVKKGTVVTIQLVGVPSSSFDAGKYADSSVTLGTIYQNETVNFNKIISSDDPSPVKYEVNGVENNTDVKFTYTIDGQEASSVVKASIPTGKTKPVATLELSAKIGAVIEVSATAENYQISAFDGYSVTAIGLTDYYFKAVSGQDGIAGATFNLTYVDNDEDITLDLTADKDGIVKVTLPSAVYSSSFVVSKDGKVIEDVLPNQTFYVGLEKITTGRTVDLGTYYSDAVAKVSIKYGAVYNVEDISYGPVAYEPLVGYTASANNVVDSIALKAPSIDNFEFVAWMVDGVVVSEKADYTLVVEDVEEYDAIALYSAVHYEEPAEGLSMNVLVIGIVILILGILAVAYGIISKKQ